MEAEELVGEHLFRVTQESESFKVSLFLVERWVGLDRASVLALCALECVCILDGNSVLVSVVHVGQGVSSNCIPVLTSYVSDVRSDVSMSVSASRHFEQEGLELNQDRLHSVGRVPTLVSFGFDFSHVETESPAKDVWVGHVGEERDRWWGHWIVLGEVYLEMEHAALVGGAFGATNIGVPAVDTIIQRGC